MLVYKHLSTCQCSFLVPIHCTIIFGFAPKCLYTSIWTLFSAHSWSQDIILSVADAWPNACTRASEHFSVLIHGPNILYHKFRTCAQMLVYKHLSTCQCSFMMQIYHTRSFGCMSHMLVHKHLSTCQCSFIVPTYYIRGFGLAPKCLYTSTWTLFSAHSSSRYMILEVSDLCPDACI